MPYLAPTNQGKGGHVVIRNMVFNLNSGGALLVTQWSNGGITAAERAAGDQEWGPRFRAELDVTAGDAPDGYTYALRCIECGGLDYLHVVGCSNIKVPT